MIVALNNRRYSMHKATGEDINKLILEREDILST